MTDCHCEQSEAMSAKRLLRNPDKLQIKNYFVLDRRGFASRLQRIPHHNREIKIYSTKIKADAYFRSATSNYPVMEFRIPWVDSGFSSSLAERRTFFALVDFDHYLWLSEVQIWEKSAFQDILRALYWAFWDAIWKDLWFFYRYYLRKAKILGKVLCHLSFLCDFVCKFDWCAVWPSRDYVPLTRKLYHSSNRRYWL